jgi:gluconate kinase
MFIYLKADLLLIHERLKKRTGHFMNPALIESQFDTLEQPRGALRVDARLTPATIVQRIRKELLV